MSYDEHEIRKALTYIVKPDSVFEIRILDSKKNTRSGYFKSADSFLQALRRQELDGCNVYVVLNEINPACYDREQKERFKGGKIATTSDNDIISRRWLFLDFDPKRPAGTSATDEQVKKAEALCNRVRGFMIEQGFQKPIVAFSGNGYHLLFRIDMPNTEKSLMYVKNVLGVLDELFTTDEVGVDIQNCNAARICKLYGTVANKGSDSAERPHRMSRMIEIPKPVEVTAEEYLKKIIFTNTPEKPVNDDYNNYDSRSFDIEAFLQKHGVGYKPVGYGNGTKYVLDRCPFDENHKAPDAAVFKRNGGALAFKCFHNSCADRRWKDFRLFYEPDAYSQQREREERQMYRTYNRDRPMPRKSEPIVEKEGEPVFLTAGDILAMKTPPESFIKTGADAFDRRTRGLKKNYCTLLTGFTGSAKSTMLSQIILNAIDAGNAVDCFSGEMYCKDFMQWMYLQAAGRERLEPGRYEGFWSVPIETQRQIAGWLGERFHLYNNDYGYEFQAILDKFEEVITKHRLDLLVLDNLMALDISALDYDKYAAQKKFAWGLHGLANKYHIHILYVAHPRKQMGFLRLYDVSGSADLVNAAENVVLMHRVNNDFKKGFRENFGCEYSSRLDAGATNFLEIAKARGTSISDADGFVPLYYDRQTFRLRNSETEQRVYGWNRQEWLDADKMENPFT